MPEQTVSETSASPWPQRLLSPYGRIDRRPFWIAMAAMVVVSLTVQLVLPSQMRLVGNLLQLGVLYPAFCLLAQRFRDIGRSGWLAAAPAVLLGLSFVLGALGLAFFRDSHGLMLLGGLMLLAGLIVTVVFLIWAGTAPGLSQPHEPGQEDSAAA